MNAYYSHHTVIASPTTINADNIHTTSIRFSWSEATCSSACPDGITGYIYNLDQLATGVRVASSTVGASERMVTIEGLTMCTDYTFTVAGLSGGVTGTYSYKSVTTAAGEGKIKVYPKSVTCGKVVSKMLINGYSDINMNTSYIFVQLECILRLKK